MSNIRSLLYFAESDNVGKEVGAVEQIVMPREMLLYLFNNDNAAREVTAV